MFRGTEGSRMLTPAGTGSFAPIARAAHVGTWVAALVVMPCAARAEAAPTRTADHVDFNRDVRPILSGSCFKCHGVDDAARKGKLRLDVRESALKGGKSGDPAVTPGKPDDSELVRRVFSNDPDGVMPPASTKVVLTDAQQQTLRRWVAQGAEYQPHWAFVAPKRAPLPDVKQADWCRNTIDRFVLSRLEAEGLRPSSEADRYTLVRRLYLDLIGIPPTPAEADAFVGDPSPDAYEKVVDRLLASPHYGERWARRWLDLARYADTNGYEKDRARPIWPYRDWVIQAINRDQPFDQFTIEQIAGDMLPGAGVEQRIATGFHRNTMLNEEGGIDPNEYRFLAMTDRVATTGTVWLGLTIGCAQCHTHKYDPIPHKDYYGLFAFFNSASEVDLPLPSPTEIASYPKRLAAYNAEKKALEQSIERDESTSRPARQAAWEATLASATPESGPAKDLPEAIAEILATPVADRCPVQVAELADYHRTIDPTSVKLARQRTALAKKAPVLTTAKVMVLAENSKP